MVFENTVNIDAKFSERKAAKRSDQKAEDG